MSRNHKTFNYRSKFILTNIVNATIVPNTRLSCARTAKSIMIRFGIEIVETRQGIVLMPTI